MAFLLLGILMLLLKVFEVSFVAEMSWSFVLSPFGGGALMVVGGLQRPDQAARDGKA